MLGSRRMPVKALDDTLLLAKGNERWCYIHPDDDSKVIKITHKVKDGRSQNLLEAAYYRCLQEKGTPLTHLADCYGWIEIAGQKGLVFERIRDYDGNTALTLNQIIRGKLLSLEKIKSLLDDLIDYLEENKIVFVDSSFDNIICQRLKDGSYRLVIIDGLGGRRLGWKFWLYCHLPVYLNYKVKRQGKKVLRNLEIALNLYG